MCTWLYSYVEKLSLLYPRQFGFRDMALIHMQDLITDAINSKKHSLGIFLDLAKAFDMVNHKMLIKRWSTMGPWDTWHPLCLVY